MLQWKEPFAKWFVGGQLNVSYNCLDRHLGTPTANKAALIWEGEPAGPGKPGEERTLTYQQLHREVCLFANVLKRNGIKKGDRVIIYLPMVPEAAIAMLACARIGAVHSVVFGGFSAQSVADRIYDCQAKTGHHRRRRFSPRRGRAAEEERGRRARAQGRQRRTCSPRRSKKSSCCAAPTTKSTSRKAATSGGIASWNRSMPIVPAEKMDSEAPLFILYTSGSTGKPKGILHTTGGYLLGAKMTTKYVFDLQRRRRLLVHRRCRLGHRPQLRRLRPARERRDEPDVRRRAELPGAGSLLAHHREIWRHDSLHRADRDPRLHEMGRSNGRRSTISASLRLLGTVGEPINPEAWMWYHEVIGGKRCPIVDTWWQTETGGIMITPLPGATPTKPGSATLPFFGIVPEVVDDQGNPVPRNPAANSSSASRGRACCADFGATPNATRDVYWSEVKGSYFTGDGCRQDKDGYFWIVGRIDDVLNVAGHRIGTAEVESALVSHPKVAEAAVVGRPDELKGQALVAFVTVEDRRASQRRTCARNLRKHVAKEIGPVAKPDDIRFAEALPKTRSGKIMRRLLKQIAAGGEIKGDTTTLEDFSVLAKLAHVDE